MKFPLLIPLVQRRAFAFLTLALLAAAAIAADPQAPALPTKPGEKVSGYAAVNGLSMYYEVIGVGRPTVYLHPILSHCGLVHDLPQDRRWILLDRQGHGRTADIDRPISCEQDADDAAALLAYLGIDRADVVGVSFGGAIAVTMAIRHPSLVGRIVSYGSPLAPIPKEAAATLKPDGDYVGWERDQYSRVAPDPARWPTVFAKVVKAGTDWKGLSADELKALQTPILIACGDHDLIPIERCVELARLLPNGQLAVIPDASHFVLFSEPQRFFATVIPFLDSPKDRVPLSTFVTGYHPGVTR